jgi:hypothetical protein
VTRPRNRPNDSEVQAVYVPVVVQSTYCSYLTTHNLKLISNDHDMKNSDDDADDYTESDTGNGGKKGGASEAGFFRGLARSIGRSSGTTAQKGISMMRMPTIGRLPATTGTIPSPISTANTASKVIFRQGPIPKVSPPKIAVNARPSNLIPKRVPVKQVVKVSDHVSQGLSFIDSASESSTNSNITQKNAFEERIMKLQTFASSK